MLRYLEHFVRRILINSGVADRGYIDRLRGELERRAQLAVAEAQALAAQRLADEGAALEQRLARADGEVSQRLAQVRVALEQSLADAWAASEGRFAFVDAELSQRLGQAGAAEGAKFAQLQADLEQRVAGAVSGLEGQLAALRAEMSAARWAVPDVALHGLLEPHAATVSAPQSPAARDGGGELVAADWTPPLHFAFPLGGSEDDDLAEALRALGHDVTASRKRGTAPAPLAAFTRVAVGRGAQAREIVVNFDWGDTGFPLEAVEWLNANVAAVACATAHAEKALRDHGCTVPLATVGSGIDGWERLARDRAYAAPGKAFRFLHVSGCGADQAMGTLLDAFGQVFAQDDDVSLLIRPADGEADDLVADIAERRRFNPAYPDVVVITGALPDAALKALYSQCHVFVSAGRAEGFAPEIAHALLSGLPVIATGWGGHLDYCSAETGWLVDYAFARAPSPVGVLASAWAEPLPKALEEALWFAYRADPADRFSKAWNGRKGLLAGHGWTDVALRLARLAAQAGKAGEAGKARMSGTVGFVTSWNSKCGIAGYMGHMLEDVEPTDYVVFADKWSTTLKADPANCLRSWMQGPLVANGLSEILSHLERCSVRTLVVQFNYGFYNPVEFRQLVDGALAQGVGVIVELHSTVDPPQGILPIRLADFAEALRKCQTVLAHTPADMSRLKALGICGNVALFPLGTVVAREISASRTEGHVPEIASFGFALPNKGLPELVEAIGLLRAEGGAVRLRMWNAEYPASVSVAELDKVRANIERFGLGDLVEVHSEYRDDADCARVLSGATLIVNSYQETSESSSAAVRFALASRAPVMVTPLPIFDELGDAVFRSKGTDARALADGIAESLSHLTNGTRQAQTVQAASSRWVEQHSAHALGERLMRLGRSAGTAQQRAC